LIHAIAARLAAELTGQSMPPSWEGDIGGTGSVGFTTKFEVVVLLLLFPIANASDWAESEMVKP
jgi:hypothetical protein